MISPLLQKEKIQSIRMENGLYEPMDFFMLRAPLLPSYHYSKLNEKNLREELCQFIDNDYFREAVILASPSLYDSLEYLHRNPEDRKEKQLVSSVYRYINRMSTRPTPFGLFAGVTVGELSSNTDIRLGDLFEHKKRSRPDMEWLLKLIFKIELDQEMIDELKVKKNSMVTKVGTRIKIPYAVRHKNNQEISINCTEPVDIILDISKDWIKFKDIVEILHTRYPEVPKQKLKEFTMELIKQEVVLTELRPPLQIPNPFDYLVNKLEELPEEYKYLEKLKEIKELINEYDRYPVGKGIGIFKELRKKMNSLVKTDKVLQVDTLLHTQKNSLNKEVGEEFALAAECLWSLSSPPTRPYTHIQAYHKVFVENYGTYTEVPILELLSEELGLGIPEGYKDHELAPSRYITTPIQQKLFSIIIQGIKNNEEVIYLKDDLIEEAKKQKRVEDAPDSYELYGEINVDTSNSVDNGDFEIILSPMLGSREAGQTFGRFMDMIGPDILEKFKNTHRELQKRKENSSVLVEASYLSASLRTNNLTLGEKYRDYELTLGSNSLNTDKKIDITDIYVVATSTHLYFKSKKLNKEVIFTGGNMLNYQNSPSIYKFMREVSESRITHWNPLDKNFLIDLPYIPRIKYRKTVLSPARWKFSKQIAESEFLSDSDAKWIESFQEWRSKWKIPRYVFMTFADNRLLLDLENSYSLLEIKNQIKKTPSIQLIENIALNKKGINDGFGWVQGKNNERFTMECVVPVVKKKEFLSNPSLDMKKIQRSASNIDKNKLFKLPGSDYFYAKLYVPLELHDKFIINELLPFATEMIGDKAIDNWFFMRYKDSKDHIRLRFKGDPKILSTRLFNNFNYYAHKWFEKGLLKRFAIDTYEREINRYGGPRLIEMAEEFFYRDSQVTIESMGLYNSKNLDLPKEALASISIVDFLHQTGLTYEEQLGFLERFVSKNDFIEEYRAYRKKLVEISDPYRNWQGLLKHDPVKSLHKNLVWRGAILKEYFEQIDELEMLKEAWNSKVSILNSLIHMHCNRLMGIDRKLETKAYAFARHTLYGQKYWRNKVDGEY
ncbi:lantibiotic dehydratase [Pseudobacillus badius]|uniref:lantibiotic dehydratase n=1 Tax=Bacillus badius TaxID=1455 RepID=UPI003D331647